MDSHWDKNLPQQSMKSFGIKEECYVLTHKGKPRGSYNKAKEIEDIPEWCIQRIIFMTLLRFITTANINQYEMNKMNVTIINRISVGKQELPSVLDKPIIILNYPNFYMYMFRIFKINICVLKTMHSEFSNILVHLSIPFTWLRDIISLCVNDVIIHGTWRATPRQKHQPTFALLLV